MTNQSQAHTKRIKDSCSDWNWGGFWRLLRPWRWHQTRRDGIFGGWGVHRYFTSSINFIRTLCFIVWKKISHHQKHCNFATLILLAFYEHKQKSCSLFARSFSMMLLTFDQVCRAWIEVFAKCEQRNIAHMAVFVFLGGVLGAAPNFWYENFKIEPQ